MSTDRRQEDRGPQRASEMTRGVSLHRDDLRELASAVLARGAPFTFVATGVSMLPFVRGGDRLTVVPCRGEELRRGEIAFYQAEEGRVMAHRVLGRSRDGLTLLVRGDAVWRLPERVAPDDVLGRVRWLQRGNARKRRVDRGHCLLAILWHALFPLPLRIYRRTMRLLNERDSHPGAERSDSPYDVDVAADPPAD